VKVHTAVSAGGVIVDDQGRVVLTGRRSFKGRLQWGLPKGLLEPGEEPAAAAAREAREETGLEVEVLAPITTIDYWYVQPAFGEDPPRRVHKFVHFFLMRPVGGTWTTTTTRRNSSSSSCPTTPWPASRSPPSAT
jgi:8-oxo-dGTP pyrophosphatase MutT (NUDIX family)